MTKEFSKTLEMLEVTLETKKRSKLQEQTIFLIMTIRTGHIKYKGYDEKYTEEN